MDNPFFTQQLELFANKLRQLFLRAGFEVVEEPYYSLYGFRATYIRRYLFHRHSPYCDGVLTALIHVIGLPFGRQGQKMVILSAPRNIQNEPISDTLKIRVQFNNSGNPYVVHGDQQQSTAKTPNSFDRTSSSSSGSPPGLECDNTTEQFAHDLASYVSHILETISPGLIELPTEMKIEILKKLSVDSIIKMAQVNSEFKALIFQHGESLWRHLCFRDFRIKFINRLVHRSWMELYRDSYILHQIEVCRKERALPGLPERPALPPVPPMLQIEWFPEVLALPFYPLHAQINPEHQDLQLALEFGPMRRADSLDSIH